MFYFLIILGIVFFITHVMLLLLSFKQAQLLGSRYFSSHVTLWLTGMVVFVLAMLYSGTGRSAFLDYFDSFPQKLLILVFTLALSLVAHSIVRMLVLPLLKKN